MSNNNNLGCDLTNRLHATKTIIWQCATNECSRLRYGSKKLSAMLAIFSVLMMGGVTAQTVVVNKRAGMVASEHTVAFAKATPKWEQRFLAANPSR